MPAAAAREPSAAWDPTDTRPCSSAGAAYARAVLRELPGSGDDLRSTHSVSLSPARTGFLVTGTYRAVSVLRLFSGVARMQSVRGRLAGSRLSGAIGHQRIVGRGNICSSFGHSSDIRRACLPPPLHGAVSRILDRTPRPPERNSLPPACLRARALRWLFDHGNASNYLLVCCSIVMHPCYRSLMKIIQLRCEQY